MAGTPVSRSSMPTLTRGKDTITSLLGLSYGSIDGQHKEIFETYTSNKRYEEDVALVGMGTAFKKNEGESVSFDTFGESYTSRYEHDTIAIGFMVTEEMKEDNLHMDAAAQGAKWMGRSMANTKQQKAANILNNGFNTSYTGGDGQALFSTAHPTMKAGSFSNKFSVDLSEDALENMIIATQNLKDESGILINARAKKIIIPPALEFKLYRILNAEKRVATADNDPNAMRGRGSISTQFVINNRLTDSDAFYILTDVPDGLKHYVRTPMSVAFEGDFDTGNIKYKSRERYAFGWSDPRAIVGSEGA